MTNDVWVIAMPKLGETVTEGTLGTWLKQVGDTVALDDPLFEVSTDKVDSEVPSPYDGVIVEILVAPGETVPVGTPLARIGPPGSSTGQQAPTPTGEVFDITMPKLGETVTEGTLGTWLKQVGDTVAMDDPLFEVSTDKVDSEVPSPYDGVLLEVLVDAGETVPVGTVLARIGEPGATTASAPASASAPQAAVTMPTGNGHGRLLSPLVRRLAAEHGIDLATVSGSGASGRIRREDVEKVIAGKANDVVTAPAPAAPVAVAEPPAPRAAAQPAASADPRDEIVPLSRMRLAVADGMKRSQATAASVWTSVEVDFDNVEKARQKHKARFKKETGASLSYLPFISRAVVDALRAYPTVNSSIDIEAKSMTLHPYVNLGIAVDLDEQGLVVPVVRDADGLNMRGIASKITQLAAAARGKKLPMSDMQGSTFTITNPGPFASYASAPIINQPNTGILCTDGVKRRPVAVGDAIAIHPVGIIGLVYDHRAFDGSTASKFLMHLRDSLEQRDWDAEVG